MAVAVFEDGFIGERESVAIEPEVGCKRATCRQQENE